jgi:hypothetical protein
MTSSFLERYERGEHEQVWDELVALGAAVREEPVYTEALAVARETMRRARRNIEMLIPRLAAIGYQFGYGWVQPFVRERLLHPYRVADSGQYGQLVEPSIPDRFSYRYRIAYQEYLELAGSMPPLFVPSNDREEQIAQLEANIAATAPSQSSFRDQMRAMQAELQAKPSAQDLVEELEALVGTLPLSVHAWYEEVGGVNFVGDHPDWRALLPESVIMLPMGETDYVNPMYALNPLLIHPLDEAWLADMRAWTQRDQARQRKLDRYPLNLAPGERIQYLDNSGIRGSHVLQMILPALGVDAPCVIPGNQMFVAYLRECFRWGGFRGWAKLETRPEQDIAFLTQGLLPI